jgi:hypothetical protein
MNPKKRENLVFGRNFVIPQAYTQTFTISNAFELLNDNESITFEGFSTRITIKRPPKADYLPAENFLNMD